MRATILRAIARLKYYRGNVSMRVCFGQFVLSQFYKGRETMSRDEFDFMMGMAV